jgi:large subunit ribosomal protein L17
MRHRMSGKQLGRTTSHRKALRRNMAVSLFEHGAIRTTPVKAKELRRFVERLITLARKGTLHARRQVIAALGRDRALLDDEGELAEKTVVQKLFDEIAPRYEDRPGGYTRIIHLPERRIGDGGGQVILQLVEEATGRAGESEAGTSRRKRRAAKRHEALAGVAPAPEAEAEEPDEQEEGEPAEPADETDADADSGTDDEAQKGESTK